MSSRALTLKTVPRLMRVGRKGRTLDSTGPNRVPGLYLQVLGKNNASWLLRFEVAGRKRWMGLGWARTFDLAEARTRAIAARKLLADKIDPLTLRRAERAQAAAQAANARTFEQCANEFFQAKGGGWSQTHQKDFPASLKRHVHPTIGHLPIGDIDQALVLTVLRPLWAGLC